MDAALGLAYAVSGKKEQTMKLAETFKSAAKKRYIPPTYFGMLFAGLGDQDKALMWLEKAFADRADGLTWLNVEPMLDEVRSDPRFQDLIRRIGTDEHRQNGLGRSRGRGPTLLMCRLRRRLCGWRRFHARNQLSARYCAPSLAVKYASLRLNPAMPAQKLLGKRPIKVL